MVMVGGLFSKLIDSPAEVVDGHKVYYGSASQYNKGEYRNVEGIKRTLPLEPMTYREKLLEIEEDLQSAVSYAGGEHIYDVRKVKSLQVTHWEV
jgi:GMP reductase